MKELNSVSLETGRKPPQALDIEEAVLGALLLEPDAVTEVIDVLTPECFYKDANRRIYKAVAALASRHDSVDILTVAEELKKTGDLDIVGGPYYLTMLSNKIGAAAHLDYHVKILIQKYIQRELISISYNIQKDSFDDSKSVDDLLDIAQQKIFALADKNLKRDTLPVKDVISEAVTDLQTNQERTDGLSGIPSGYTGIDRMTLGWQASDLIIIAARPSVGKTAFVLTMARNMTVDHHVPVAFFSLEMSSKQLVKRLMISETGISADKIYGGKKLEDYEWVQLEERLKSLSAAPLYIDDTPSLGIYELRTKARKLVATAGVKLIIIDYLQLMSAPSDMKQGVREQEVSAISRNLKAIAKELEIPIIALSQLNRSVDTRGGNGRPMLSDLRESGAIEQDADIVMFIHRYDRYGLESEKNQIPGYTDIIIAKHRNGEVGDVHMKFRSSEVRFVDLEDSDMDAAMYGTSPIQDSRMNGGDQGGYNGSGDF